MSRDLPHLQHLDAPRWREAFQIITALELQDRELDVEGRRAFVSEAIAPLPMHRLRALVEGGPVVGPASLQEAASRLEAAARLHLARRSLIDWVSTVSQVPGGYQAGWCHRRLCRALERFSDAVARQESPRLIVVMPPRHGKTQIVSRTWPVWHLAQYPGHEFVCAAYGQTLADDNSSDARDVARSAEALEVFPELGPELQENGKPETLLDNVRRWKVGNGASYGAVGVGVGLTGKGAHILAIDDPFKDRAEADSELRRRKVWDWYASTAYTRLAPGGGIIVMATRWHEDDLIGKLLAQQAQGRGDTWEVLHLEAIASEDDPVAEADLDLVELCGGLEEDEAGQPCWRLAGQALHRARFDERRLERIRAAITAEYGTKEWEALYQGRPVPEGGNRIRREWLRERYSCTPEQIANEADEVWVSVDSAKKGKENSDFHAIHVWARKGTKRYLLDRVCDRMTYPDFELALDGVIERWAFWLATKGGVLVEDTANGTTYMQIRGSFYKGVAIVPFSPTKDTPGSDKGKEARAVYLERAAEAGAVWLPTQDVAGFIVEDVITWWCAFPLGKHDDDVDAASQILMRWTVEDRPAGGGAFEVLLGAMGM